MNQMMLAEAIFNDKNMTDSPDILDRVRAYLGEHKMVSEGETVVIGVSGGPDSVALLDLLCRLQKHGRFSLHVAHLDHCLRPTSDEDRNFVQGLASKRDLVFHTDALDVAALARAEKRSLEEAGRIARHGFLDRVRRRTGANRIALGHTQSDQAETLLMRLLRGAGTTGLGGIRPVRDGVWIRPLLGVGRSEIEAYLTFRGLEARIDATNTDIRFLRNRIRSDLIPHLKARYSGSVETLLARTAEILQKDDEWLEKGIEPALKSVVLYRDKRKIILDVKRLFGYHISICRRLLRRVLYGLSVRPSSIDFRSVERLCDLLKKGTGAAQIGADLSAQITDCWLILSQPTPAFHVPLDVPGEAGVAGVRLQARILEARTVQDQLHRAPPTVAYFDRDVLNGGLIVRSRKPGDRIQPFGMTGTQKVSNLLVDTKIPRPLRDAQPLLCCGDTILWAPGLRRSRFALVTPQTRQVVEVVFEGSWHDLIAHPKRSL